MKKFGWSIVLALLAFVVAACAPQAQTQMQNEAPAADQTMADNMAMETMMFTVDASGDQEVPPVETLALGSVNVTLEGNRLMLDGTFQGLESDLMEVAGTPAHIHEAPIGENGPVVLPVAVTVNEDGRSGTVNLSEELTPEQLEAFRAGRFYLNIHTQENGGGELRAQLVPPGSM
jgi:hypothetical protein